MDTRKSVENGRRRTFHRLRCTNHPEGDTTPPGAFACGQRGLAFMAVRESVGPNRLGPEFKHKFGGIDIAGVSLALPVF